MERNDGRSAADKKDKEDREHLDENEDQKDGSKSLKDHTKDLFRILVGYDRTEDNVLEDGKDEDDGLHFDCDRPTMTEEHLSKRHIVVEEEKVPDGVMFEGHFWTHKEEDVGDKVEGHESQDSVFPQLKDRRKGDIHHLGHRRKVAKEMVNDSREALVEEEDQKEATHEEEDLHCKMSRRDESEDWSWLREEEISS